MAAEASHRHEAHEAHEAHEVASPPQLHVLDPSAQRPSWVLWWRPFFAPTLSDRLLAALVDEHSFEQKHIVLFGREVLQPRLIAWAGDVAYRYSGSTLEARPWSTTLAWLRAVVSRAICAALTDAGVDAAAPSFNHALLNYYADGLASMGAHSDDEAELGPEPCIASLSFGATRRFLVRPKRAATRQRSLGFDLAHGELFVMGGAMQHEYKHALPKTKEAVGPRLNITLRGVRAPIASSSAARGHRRA